MVLNRPGRASAPALAMLLGLVAVSACGPSNPYGKDAGPTDAGVSDAGADAGPRDGGHDAGPTDAGTDAGPEDGGPTDAGTDAGPQDAGPQDAGIDAGPEDGGIDAGPQDAGIDAGPQDAGIDAGPEDGGPRCDDFTEAPPQTNYVSNAGLGEPCDMDLHTNEANCTPGLECRQMAPGSVAFCSSQCGSGFGCAPDHVGGYCVSGQPNFCLATCDENTPCPANLACNHNVCVPDCNYEPPTYCTIQFGDHTMCNRATGVCEKKTCSTSNNCPSGGTCDTTVTPHVCEYDCNTTANFCCHLGPEQFCNPTNGLCNPGGPYPVLGNALVLPNITLDAGVEDTDAGPPCNDQCNTTHEDGGVDAGIDCQPYDGGPLPDAGRGLNAQLGEPCAPATSLRSDDTPQPGNCATGESCVAANVAGFCAKSCTADAQCGTNAGLANLCVTEKSLCVVRCDATHTCPSGATCQSNFGTTVCMPDCRREWPIYCQMLNGGTCDQATGVCKQVGCNACPTGTVCDTGQTPNVCVPNCRLQSAGYCCAASEAFAPNCGSNGLCH